MLATLVNVPQLRPEVSEMMAQVRELRQLRAGNGVALPDGGAEGASDDRGYWVVPAQSDTTLIAFTGRAQRLGLSIYFMHSLLSRLNANVIYLFDWANSFYFAGVSGLSRDTETTVAQLRALCAGLHSRRVLCIGQSAGGYGALRYGAKLNADGIIAFSPLILPVMASRTRARIEAETGLPLTEEETDLRRLLANHSRPPHIEIVYGTDNAADVASARHLAGLPTVVERPLQGVSSHGTIQETVIGKTFGPLLHAFSTAAGPGLVGPLPR